jgi:hypothetical protein
VLVGIAIVVVLAFGTERLSNHDVPDTGVLGLDGSDSASTGTPEGTQGIGQEQQG